MTTTFNVVPHRVVMKRQIGELRFKIPKGWHQTVHDASVVLACTVKKGRFAKLSVSNEADIRVEVFLNGESYLEKFEKLADAAMVLQEKLNTIR